MSFKIKVIFYLLSLKIHKKIYSRNINRLQNIRWKRLKNKISKSEYYKNFIELNTPLKDYPLMNKTLFISNFNLINTEGINYKEANKIAIRAEAERDFSSKVNNITVGLSSGTSGNRGIFLASDKERAQWVAAILDRVINFSFKKRTVAFFLRANSNLYESVKSRLIEFKYFDLLLPLDEHVQGLKKYQPDILVAQPSLLLQLAKHKEAGDLNIEPKKIISVAEVLYEEDANYLRSVFGKIIHQVYQCTEGFLASSCSYGTLHFNEDFLIIEKKYIDNEKKRFHPIVTDLKRTSQPVIRYELDDIIHEKTNCPCGGKSIAIEMIEGRSDDVLEFINDQKKRSIIFPDFFRRAIILSNENIRNYSLSQKSYNHLLLYVDGDENNYSKAETALYNLLRQKKILNVFIERVNELNWEVGSKLRRIKNEIRTTN